MTDKPERTPDRNSNSNSNGPPVIPAPNLQYRPQDPVHFRPPIGMIGCGDITTNHLRAYRRAGYDVAALCDLNKERAEQRRDEFFPSARIYDTHQELLKNDDIQVVDITTHPPERPPIIEAALLAGKHVLSQKPFVLDLDEGQRLVDLADSRGLQLAVNQNGRWAPHFAYIRAAVEAGLLGRVNGIHLSVHWNHGWVAGTPFEKVKHLLLYDYAIHWFDIICCLMPQRDAIRVYSSVARSKTQSVWPKLLAQSLIEFEDAQASLAFDADTPIGSQDRSYVAGSAGSLSSVGPGNRIQKLTINTADGTAEPELQGCWFPDGFHGTMGELLTSIEQRRDCSINARDNLRSLALCFAAVSSADTHQPVVPGAVRKLPE